MTCFLIYLSLIVCSPGETIRANEMTPYSVPVEAPPAPPEGYEPFYISHYGRHGSRTDTKKERLEGLAEILSETSEKGLLTPAGESLLADVLAVREYARGRYAFLTPLGTAQQKGIARRMAGNFPGVFSGRNAGVTCRSTSYQRCIMSMAAFSSALASCFPSLDIGLDASDRLSGQFNFYNPPEMDSSIEMMEASYLKVSGADTTAMLSLIFTDADVARESFLSARNLFSRLYFAAGTALNIPCDVDLFKYFTSDVLQDCWYAHNAFLYMYCCDSALWGEVRLPAAGMIVRDIVERAEEAVGGKGCVADFRFGHDAPLLTLLCRLSDSDVPSGCDFDNVGNFRSSSLIPMAANLQMIFYKEKSGGDVLVLCLRNEIPILLRGLVPVCGNFYKWDDIKSLLTGIF